MADAPGELEKAQKQYMLLFQGKLAVQFAAKMCEPVFKLHLILHLAKLQQVFEKADVDLGTVDAKIFTQVIFDESAHILAGAAPQGGEDREEMKNTVQQKFIELMGHRYLVLGLVNSPR